MGSLDNDKRKANLWEIIIIIFVGGCLCLTDFSAFVVFLLFVPFFYLMLISSIGNPILFSFSLYFFMAIGVENVIFWCNRSGYRRDGMLGIGDFDFSIPSFFEMNSYVLVYFITIYFVLFFVGKITQVHIDWRSIVQFDIPHKRNKKWLGVIMPLLIVLQIIMYSFGISIHGLQPTGLPFHIWGGYWYFRMFVTPIIISYILLENDSIMNWISIIIYTYFVSVCSLSRTTIILTCIPLIIFLRDKKISKVLLLILYMCLCIRVSDMFRTIIYEAALKNEWIDIFTLVTRSITMIDAKFILLTPVKVGETVCQRMGGGANLIQGGLVRTQFSFCDFTNYIVHAKLSDTMVEGLEDIVQLKKIYGNYHGLEVGYGLSYLGCIVLISQYNYLATIAHAIIVTLPMVIMYIFVWSERRKKRPYLFLSSCYFIFICGMFFFLFGGFNSFSVFDFLMFSLVSVSIMWAISTALYKFRVISLN